jgi:acyl-coenzyme A synthetase/AMP-(fatty) acid ligase
VVGKGNNIAGTEDALTFEGMITGQPDTFESVQTGADDTAVIVYTSGTTGQAKVQNSRTAISLPMQCYPPIY